MSSKAAGSLENRRKFNDGTELDTDLDLNWYETDYRSYDPQIGRFHQIDELTEFDFNWSPYVYAHNNPILLNDPLGLTADSTGKPGFTPDNPNILPDVVVTATRHKSVGQPGTLEYFIPFWGYARAAVDDFQNGRWGWGTFNTVMVITDVFLVKSAITGVGKLVVKKATNVAAKSVKNAFTFTKHGELTNGIYTVSKEAMKKHVFNTGQGKSIFYPTLNADEAVLKAAQYADEAGLWIGNKAKVPVINTNIGTLGNGSPTNVINVYRNSNGFIHGSPGTIR
jgi:RHS repeat-associated protein